MAKNAKYRLVRPWIVIGPHGPLRGNYKTKDAAERVAFRMNLPTY